ncbi:hypothetical protein H8D30_00180 [bacterium]|nr:hypothetical protein [bacterium]
MGPRLLVILSLLFLVGCPTGPARESELAVLVTHPILADVVEWVGGEKVRVDSLFLPKENPLYSPPPLDDEHRIYRLFLSLGVPWEESGISAVQSAGWYAPHRVIKNPRVSDFGGFAYWLHGSYLNDMLIQVATMLSEIDPRNGAFYHQRIQEHLEEIDTYFMNVRFGVEGVALPKGKMRIATHSPMEEDILPFVGPAPLWRLVENPLDEIPLERFLELERDILSPELLLISTYTPKSVRENAESVGWVVVEILLFPSDMNPPPERPITFVKENVRRIREGMWQVVNERPES